MKIFPDRTDFKKGKSFFFFTADFPETHFLYEDILLVLLGHLPLEGARHCSRQQSYLLVIGEEEKLRLSHVKDLKNMMT